MFLLYLVPRNQIYRERRMLLQGRKQRQKDREEGQDNRVMKDGGAQWEWAKSVPVVPECHVFLGPTLTGT